MAGVLVDAALQLVHRGGNVRDRHSGARQQRVGAAERLDQLTIVLGELQRRAHVAFGDPVKRRRRGSAGECQGGDATHMQRAHPRHSSRGHLFSEMVDIR